MKFDLNCPCGFRERHILIRMSHVPWAKVKNWPWPFILIWLQLVQCFYKLWHHWLRRFLIKAFFFSQKSPHDQFDLTIKKVKVNPGSSFDNTFKEIGPLKIFEGFLPYMGMAAILAMWPRPREQTLVPHPTEAPCEIWLWLVQWFWRWSVKMVDGRTDYCYTISSPLSLRLRWAKKTFTLS